jgi:hypothetical protein
MLRISAKQKERFWAKVDKRGPDECWPWIGATNSKGYGQVNWARHGHLYAHRLSYELANSVAPGPMLVCHHCDNRGCINPAHMFLGTNADNLADMARKGRARGGRPRKGTERARKIRTPAETNRTLET